jgi:hypothetical protein
MIVVCAFVSSFEPMMVVCAFVSSFEPMMVVCAFVSSFEPMMVVCLHVPANLHIHTCDIKIISIYKFMYITCSLHYHVSSAPESCLLAEMCESRFAW